MSETMLEHLRKLAWFSLATLFGLTAGPTATAMLIGASTAFALTAFFVFGRGWAPAALFFGFFAVVIALLLTGNEVGHWMFGGLISASGGYLVYRALGGKIETNNRDEKK